MKKACNIEKMYLQGLARNSETFGHRILEEMFLVMASDHEHMIVWMLDSNYLYAKG